MLKHETENKAMDLFSDFTDAVAIQVVTDVAPEVRLATPEQIASLVNLGCSEKAIAKWTYERAGVRLKELTREARIVELRAKDNARQFDGEKRPDVFVDLFAKAWQVDRETTARDAIAQAVASGDTERIADSLRGAILLLTPDELREFADKFVTKFAPKETGQERAA